METIDTLDTLEFVTTKVFRFYLISRNTPHCVTLYPCMYVHRGGDDSFLQFMSRMMEQYMKEEEVRSRHRTLLLQLREKTLKVCMCTPGLHCVAEDRGSQWAISYPGSTSVSLPPFESLKLVAKWYKHFFSPGEDQGRAGVAEVEAAEDEREGRG